MRDIFELVVDVFDLVGNRFFNALYFRFRSKRWWTLCMRVFGLWGKYVPAFSSSMLVVCAKENRGGRLSDKE